jgi:hypothetical protein
MMASSRLGKTLQYHAMIRPLTWHLQRLAVDSYLVGNYYYYLRSTTKKRSAHYLT